MSDQEKPRDTAPGVGEHNIRSWRQSELARASPRPAWRPRPSGSQALGYPGTAGCCGRAENGVEAQGLDLAGGRRGKRGKLRPCPTERRVLGLSCQCLVLVEAEAGSAVRPSMGD